MLSEVLPIKPSPGLEKKGKLERSKRQGDDRKVNPKNQKSGPGYQRKQNGNANNQVNRYA